MFMLLFSAVFSGISSATVHDCQTAATFHFGQLKWNHCVFISHTAFLPSQLPKKLLNILQARQNTPQCTSNYSNFGCKCGYFQTLDHLEPTLSKSDQQLSASITNGLWAEHRVRCHDNYVHSVRHSFLHLRVHFHHFNCQNLWLTEVFK